MLYTTDVTCLKKQNLAWQLSTHIYQTDELAITWHCPSDMKLLWKWICAWIAITMALHAQVHFNSIQCIDYINTCNFLHNKHAWSLYKFDLKYYLKWASSQCDHLMRKVTMVTWMQPIYLSCPAAFSDKPYVTGRHRMPLLFLTSSCYPQMNWEIRCHIYRPIWRQSDGSFWCLQLSSGWASVVDCLPSGWVMILRSGLNLPRSFRG